MKKLLALLLVALLSLSLVACGSKGDTGSDTEKLKTVKIGVEIYDPTDSEFLELKSYFDYLSENMAVEFVYSEAIASAEEEIAFIENCASSGCQGIIGYYNVAQAEAVAKSVEYGMYYWGAAADYPETLETYATNELFLGGINYGNGDYDAGYALGEFAINNGSKNIVYASGGADFGVKMFVDRQAGFLAAVGDKANVIKVSGFPGDAFFADQASALTQNIDAVCASFNGVDFWAQPIAAAGKASTVKLATIGSVNKDFVEAFESGAISFLASANIQRFGLGVGLIFNAVNGDASVYKVDGKAVVDASGYWLISSAADAKKIYDIQVNEKVYTADDVLSLCTAVNKDANRDTLLDLIKKGESENLLK